jgi:chemotaxis protein MotB
MARKHKHEDHVNHEAWAIPYGDLITLLLALFVCMYAISSVNEGKYRVLADSLSQAFGGPPKSLKPIQFGDKPEKGVVSDAMFNTVNLRGFEDEQRQVHQPRTDGKYGGSDPARSGEAAEKRAAEALKRMSEEVEKAMQGLINQQMITVRRTEQWLEIEIRTDILFPSGVSQVSPAAVPVLQKLAGILRPFPNPIRIEGHTDNRPIATVSFPSNWELSAARAASVVRLFMQSGVEPTRMTAAGLGEYRPVASNDAEDGRNRNRRVVVVVMADDQDTLRPQLPVAASEDAEADTPATPVAVTETAAAGGPVVEVPAGTLQSLTETAP